MNAPELSIVVPVYNVAPWLSECLESIAQQTFTAWEAILVDDGSTDFSGIICDSYAKKDPRFRVIHQQNAGVSAARNAGIESATASLLAFVDPDDCISSNYFESMVDCMRKTNAECVAAKLYTFTDPEAMFSPNRVKDDVMVFTGKLDIGRNFFRYMPGGVWGYIFNRSLWDGTRFPVDIDLAEDVAVTPGVVANAKIVAYDPRASYFYRKRENSLMGNVTKDRYISSVRATNMMYTQAVKNNPETLETFMKIKLNSDIFRFLDHIRTTSPHIEGSRLYYMFQLLGEASGRHDSEKITQNQESEEK